MKFLHTILTILFVVALLFGLIPFFKMANTPMGSTLGGIVGNLLAYAIIPSIIYSLRYFVGKNIDK